MCIDSSSTKYTSNCKDDNHIDCACVGHIYFRMRDARWGERSFCITCGDTRAHTDTLAHTHTHGKYSLILTSKYLLVAVCMLCMLYVAHTWETPGSDIHALLIKILKPTATPPHTRILFHPSPAANARATQELVSFSIPNVNGALMGTRAPPPTTYQTRKRAMRHPVCVRVCACVQRAPRALLCSEHIKMPSARYRCHQHSNLSRGTACARLVRSTSAHCFVCVKSTRGRAEGGRRRRWKMGRAEKDVDDDASPLVDEICTHSICDWVYYIFGITHRHSHMTITFVRIGVHASAMSCLFTVEIKIVTTYLLI